MSLSESVCGSCVVGCSCDGVVLWGCSVAAVGVVVAWHWYMRRQFWVSQVSLTGVVLMLLVVVVMCGGVVVVVACVGCVRCVACVGCVRCVALCCVALRCVGWW